MARINTIAPELCAHLVGRRVRLPADFRAPAHWSRTGTIVEHVATCGRYVTYLVAVEGAPVPLPLWLHRLELLKDRLH